MSVIITLSDPLAAQLQSKAAAEDLSVEDLAIRILHDAAEATEEVFATPEEVVARIRATPPNLANIRPATGSLGDVLENAPDDPGFDLDTWSRDWMAVDAEMKTVTRANSAAEGRR
ncbi:MAG TPA: hypothetical protein VMV69_20900 [Pirellulales bacterium]|nr:hypothetical protein [Pirellulales bacterium]